MPPFSPSSRTGATAQGANARSSASATTTTSSPSALFDYSACPAGCGYYLLNNDPSYAPPGESKLGEFFDVKQGVSCCRGIHSRASQTSLPPFLFDPRPNARVPVQVAVRLGRCPCGALQCSRCKALVPPKDVYRHICADATKEDDPATKALIAKIGKA